MYFILFIMYYFCYSKTGKVDTWGAGTVYYVIHWHQIRPSDAMHLLNEIPRTSPSRLLMHGWHKKFVATGSALQQAASRHTSTNDGMWNRSENHLCLVYRNMYVSTSVNCWMIHKVVHTCWDCMHSRFKLCRLSAPVITCCILHLPPTFWKELMKTMDS